MLQHQTLKFDYLETQFCPLLHSCTERLNNEMSVLGHNLVDNCIVMAPRTGPRSFQLEVSHTRSNKKKIFAVFGE